MAVLQYAAAFLEHFDHVLQVVIEIVDYATDPGALHAEIEVRWAGDDEMDGSAGKLSHLPGVSDHNQMVCVHEILGLLWVSLEFVPNVAWVCLIRAGKSYFGTCVMKVGRTGAFSYA